MSYRHLTMDERNVIWRMKLLGKSQAETARCLGCHCSTVSRELRRNAQFDGRYWPDVAQIKAGLRSRAHIRRPKAGDDPLMAYVADRIENRWSPEQIAGRLATDPPEHLAGRTLTHTTIYRWIWADAGRAQHFKSFLRVACKPRRKPYGKPSKRGQIPNRVSIDDRPDVVDARGPLGDWEGDSMVGHGRTGYVLTGVDRLSRFTIAGKMRRATAASTNNTFTRLMAPLPTTRRRTLTIDNGKEFARHEDLAARLQLAVYFAHPYSAWERGTNENTNGLLRQYLPKKRSFAALTEAELQTYVSDLNNRPRKCLNYRTPAEVFQQPDPLHLRC